MEAEIEKILKDLKGQGVTEESDSLYSSTTVFVRKKNGDRWLCWASNS
jgi:hypothetical protein